MDQIFSPYCAVIYLGYLVLEVDNKYIIRDVRLLIINNTNIRKENPFQSQRTLLK